MFANSYSIAEVAMKGRVDGGVIVCPGVTIGDRCVIAAGSVVTRNIPSDSLAAGNPAVVKRRLQHKQ